MSKEGQTEIGVKSMKASQPTLPTLPDWTQPQTVQCSELAATIAAAKRDGFQATGMTVLPAGKYRVTFQVTSSE